MVSSEGLLIFLRSFGLNVISIFQAEDLKRMGFTAIAGILVSILSQHLLRLLSEKTLLNL